MSKIDFYHLTKTDMEAVLLMLLKKTLAAGKRALVLCPQPAASAIDTDLWTRESDSWFAHGLDDADGQEETQHHQGPQRGTHRLRKDADGTRVARQLEDARDAH